jgi:hypothetical protein
MTRNRTYLKTAVLAGTALKTGSKCSCTGVYTVCAFSPVFALSRLRSLILKQVLQATSIRTSLNSCRLATIST